MSGRTADTVSGPVICLVLDETLFTPARLVQPGEHVRHAARLGVLHIDQSQNALALEARQ